MFLLLYPPEHFIRAQAICNAFNLSGKTTAVSFVFNRLNPVIPSNLLSQAERIILLDIDPLTFNSIQSPEIPKIYIYSSMYKQHTSIKIVTLHRTYGIPSYWERIRPAVAGLPDVRSIILPPIPLEPPSPVHPDNRKTPAIIGIPSPPLEIPEVRVIQQEYIASLKRQTELSVLSPISNDPAILRAKAGIVSLWFLPKTINAPTWSFELSTLLFYGATIGCPVPPDPLCEYVLKVPNINKAEEMILSGFKAKPADNNLYNNMINHFLDAINSLLPI